MSQIKFATLLLAFFAINPALAQTNPPVAACGLPAQGVIVLSATYTLSADCAQTGRITIASADPQITVTINGGGHTITGSDSNLHVIFGPGAILNLNDVTFDGENINRFVLVNADIVNANRVTFTRALGPSALLANPSVLNNVLFSWNVSSGNSLGGNGSAMFVGLNSSHTLTNVVFRNNTFGGGATSLLSGSTVTTNGCLTLSGNAPYDVYAPDGTTWTDNSTGPCSGTIGNGDQAVILSPQLMACGFPAAGNFDVSATYRLTADCELTGAYYISEDVNIRIIGNAYAMRTSRTGYSFYIAATSSLRLENIALEGVRILNWGDFRAEKLKVSDTVGGIMFNMGEARFSNALFEDNSTPNAASRSVALAYYNPFNRGYTSFTHATFRGNSGGYGVLATFGAVIDLNGCIHFEGNSPADTYVYAGRGGVINDNRDPNCHSPIDPLIPPPSGRPSAPSAPKAICNPHCPELLLRYCDIKLGAIGLVCRPPKQPPEAYVYRIRPNAKEPHLYAEGRFLLGVTQPQVEAQDNGLVACSADGRVAVRTGLPPEIRHFFEIDPKYREELAVPRRYILISKGPNVEGKVNHAVLDNALDGRVFGIVSTFGGPPAAECIARQAAEEPTPAPVQYAPFVQPQTAQPNGSIVHIVRPGDTINGIAVAYETDPLEIIIFNQLEHMGRWIYPGQELLIREAGA